MFIWSTPSINIGNADKFSFVSGWSLVHVAIGIHLIPAVNASDPSVVWSMCRHMVNHLPLLHEA